MFPETMQNLKTTATNSLDESYDPSYSPSQTPSDGSGPKSPIAGRTRSKQLSDKTKTFKASEQVIPALELNEEGKVVITSFSGRPPSVASSRRQALHTVAYAAFESMITNAVNGYEPEIAFYRIIALSDSLLGNATTNALSDTAGINLGFLHDWKEELKKREDMEKNPPTQFRSIIIDAIKEQKRKIFPVISHAIKSILTQRNMKPGTAFAEKGNVGSATDEGSQIKLAKDSLGMLSSEITKLLNNFDELSKTEVTIPQCKLLEAAIVQQHRQLQGELRGTNIEETFQTQSLSIKLYSGLIEKLRTKKPKTKQDFENIIQDIIEEKLVDNIAGQILNMFHYPHIPQIIDAAEMKKLITTQEYRSKDSFRTNDVGSLAIQISDLLGAIYEIFPNLKGIEGSSREDPLHLLISKMVVDKIIEEQGWEQAVVNWHGASTDVDKSKLTPADHLFSTVYDIFNSVDKYHGLFDDVNKSARFSSEASSEARELGSGNHSDKSSPREQGFEEVDRLSLRTIVTGMVTSSEQDVNLIKEISDEKLIEELQRRYGEEFILVEPDLFPKLQTQLEASRRQNILLNQDEILQKLSELKLEINEREEISGKLTSQEFIEELNAKFANLNITDKEIFKPASDNFIAIIQATSNVIRESDSNITRKSFLGTLNSELTKDYKEVSSAVAIEKRGRE